MQYDRYITTDDGVIKNGKLIKSDIPGFTVYVGSEWKIFLSPVLKGLRDLVPNLIKAGACADKNGYGLEPEGFGLDEILIAKVIFCNDRQIIENPTPKHSWDNYLVVDYFRIGLQSSGHSQYFTVQRNIH